MPEVWLPRPSALAGSRAGSPVPGRRKHALVSRELPPGTPARRRWAWSLLACGLAAVAASVGIALADAPTRLHAGYVPVDRATRAPDTYASSPAPAPTLSRGEPPTLLSIPSLHVHARVIPVTVAPDGSLGVPDDPRTLGWWSAGAATGAASGSTVIDGHVDSATRGLGALFTLRRLQVGASILVRAGQRDLHYQVTGIREYPKAQLPASVFSQNVTGRLVLITCGGTFNPTTHHYADNVVVYALPS